GPYRRVLPLRVQLREHQLPRLPEARRVARRVLHDVQHLREREHLLRRARLRLRPGEDARRPGRAAAVLQHHPRLRRAPTRAARPSSWTRSPTVRCTGSPTATSPITKRWWSRTRSRRGTARESAGTSCASPTSPSPYSSKAPTRPTRTTAGWARWRWTSRETS